MPKASNLAPAMASRRTETISTAALTCDFGGAEGIRTPDPLHAMELSAIGQCGQLSRNTRLISTPDLRVALRVALHRPVMAPHLAPQSSPGGAGSEVLSVRGAGELLAYQLGQVQQGGPGAVVGHD